MTTLLLDQHPTTAFLPAARTSPGTLSDQRRRLHGHDLVTHLCDTVPHPLAILNAERQVVFANRTLVDLAGTEDLDVLAGQRPGEVLGCAVAAEAPGGCGTDARCRSCGSALAVAAAQRGQARELSCTIERADDCVPLEFAASASPLRIAGEDFVLLVLTDVRDQHRRRTLERIFFHDVINTAGGVLGIGEALVASLPEAGEEVAELGQLLLAGGQQLLEEIRAQRDLAAAESGDLAVDPRPTDLGQVVAAVAETYRHHPVGAERALAVSAGPAVTLATDATLLGRVVGNLVKNALEAVGAGQTVRLGWTIADAEATVTVWNPGVVAPSVRDQLFRRTVSTKGAGRGQGTYSVRLLTERYLGGRITWDSTPEAGTTVRIHLPA
jgi:signal transduction histidine kinase